MPYYLEGEEGEGEEEKDVGGLGCGISGTILDISKSYSTVCCSGFLYIFPIQILIFPSSPPPLSFLLFRASSFNFPKKE